MNTRSRIIFSLQNVQKTSSKLVHVSSEKLMPLHMYIHVKWIHVIKACRCTISNIKGTVSPDYKGLEVISIKSPLLGHVTPDI